VAYSQANEAEEIHDAMNLYKKCISLSKEKDLYYYDSYYKLAVCNNHIANKLWEEKKYTEADKTYKEALVNLNSAEPLTNLSINLPKENTLKRKKTMKIWPTDTQKNRKK
jgi:tetratricopeptide (TPR) repeat protein